MIFDRYGFEGSVIDTVVSVVVFLFDKQYRRRKMTMTGLYQSSIEHRGNWFFDFGFLEMWVSVGLDVD